MSVLLLLLIASLSVAGLFLGAFIWSVKNKQFDDGFSPPRRILFEEPPVSSDIPKPTRTVTLSTSKTIPAEPN